MRSWAVVPLLAACVSASDEERWAGNIDTLPNGTVRVTNPAQGIWRDDTGWRLVPGLVVGDADGQAGGIAFGVVSGLEVDDAGRIYVLDRLTSELRIFAPDGSPIRTVGRTGAGPGEYRNANGLRWLTSDTLLVVDQRGARYTILSKDGEYVRSVRRQFAFYGWMLFGGVQGGRIYERAYVGSEPDLRTVFVGTALQSADSAPPPVDTVWLPVPAGPLYDAFVVRTANSGMSIGVPFAAEPLYRLGPSGGVWHGHGSVFRLFHSSLAGDTLREIVLEVEPAPVTDVERADWEATDDVRQFRDMGGKIDLGRIPKVKPFFDGLTVDPDGYLWVSVPAGPREVAFRVFDPEGRYLGRLGVGGLETDPYVPPVVRKDKLCVVGRDELDVQRVHVFVIAKP